MRYLSKTLCWAAIGSTLALSSCSSSGVFSSPEYIAVTISPRPASVPAGGTLVLNGAASNNLSLPSWTLLNAANAPSVGTLTSVSGSLNSILYTAPPSPPIYSNVPANFTQGTVTIQATVTPPPGSANLPMAHDAITVFITASSITVAISPLTATVPLGTTQTFTAYAVGNVNNALTWQVNGVTGGSDATGTITTQGVYTAPAVVPMTGNTVTISAISQADSSKSASAVVTLQ